MYIYIQVNFNVSIIQYNMDQDLDSIEPGKRKRPETLKKLQENEKQQNSNSKKSASTTLQKLMVSKVTNFKKYDQSKEKSLSREFFRQEVVELSKALLGKVFIRKTDKGVMKAIIVETQAYKAPDDQACHAKNNTKTERTKYFWLDGGHLYIYTIYMPTNICLNVVAGLQNQPEAVLIRAVQPIEGIELIQENRKIKSPKLQDLCNGPGKVGLSLNIDKQKMNGIDLMEGDFKIVDAGLDGFSMGVSKRVNIGYAGQWVDKPWRFYVQGNTYVSKANFNQPVKKKKK